MPTVSLNPYFSDFNGFIVGNREHKHNRFGGNAKAVGKFAVFINAVAAGIKREVISVGGVEYVAFFAGVFPEGYFKTGYFRHKTQVNGYGGGGIVNGEVVGFSRPVGGGYGIAVTLVKAGGKFGKGIVVTVGKKHKIIVTGYYNAAVVKIGSMIGKVVIFAGCAGCFVGSFVGYFVGNVLL
ncbi:MAG: hypothetical protein BWY46_02048 [Firmicutes bacterium ADurb.Bin300]|nr:MAG: hypothetical protein BWY46_02048 [Firmicutes bacterium ADurb.Bin300]